MKNLRNSLLLQYLTPKHIMTNKKLILKLFAGETRGQASRRHRYGPHASLYPFVAEHEKTHARGSAGCVSQRLGARV